MRLVDVTRVEKDTGERFEAYFQYCVTDERFTDASADPFAAAMLLPCMRAGEPLEIGPPISPQLSFNLPRPLDRLLPAMQRVNSYLSRH